MRTIFMGTPEIAAVILNTLIEHKQDIIAVVTQPDKPKGRGKEMAFPPVKELAIKNNIPVYQPNRVKDEEFIKIIEELNPDIIIVAAFGQILSQRLLDIPKYGCINVHASLLPKYRGAAPYQWAIINGEEVTGVTIMQMDAGCDTGDMILKEEVTIDKEETAGSLHDKLAIAGGTALMKVIDQIKEGTMKREKQDDSLFTYAKMLDKSMGNLDFNKSAIELERLIRGLNPWPSAYTHFEGKTLKIWRAAVCNDPEREDESKQYQNGQITSVGKNSFFIKTSSGLLEILELQLEGKKRVTTAEYLRGYPIEVGYTFQK